MKYALKELRESNGLSQEKLAQLSDVSRATIAALESNREIVTTTSTLKKLSKALNCNVSDIFLDDASSILD